jgi:hypothetical protein
VVSVHDVKVDEAAAMMSGRNCRTLAPRFNQLSTGDPRSIAREHIAHGQSDQNREPEKPCPLLIQRGAGARASV